MLRTLLYRLRINYISGVGSYNSNWYCYHRKLKISTGIEEVESIDCSGIELGQLVIKHSSLQKSSTSQ